MKLTKPTENEKSWTFYDVLMRKRNAFQHLKAALSEELQTGALETLESKGWTKHGVIEYNQENVLSQHLLHTVFEGRLGARGSVAIRKAKPWRMTTDEMMDDFKLMCSLTSHSNILQCLYFEKIEKERKTKILAAFERWSCTLQECVKSDLCGIDKTSICRQITEGLSFLHLNGIIHGNLNPANIYFVSGVADVARIKLTGFGNMVSRDQASTNPDSDGLCWLPPEVILHCQQEGDRGHFV